MRAYGAIFSARFRVLLQYRAAALAGLGTQLFWGLIRVMIFSAFYQSTTAVQPMTLKETINYVWLGQALLMIVPWNTDRDVGDLIQTGNVAYELVRPFDLYWLWFCRAMAMRVAPVLLRAIPMFVLAGLFFGLGPPLSVASAVAFFVTIIGALLLSCAFTTLWSISLLWTISGEGIVRIAPTLIMFFSGLVIPLPFFPDWAQPILNILPFRGIMDVPFRLYMGNFPSEAAPSLFAHQLAWATALILLGKVLIHRGLRRVVVQGG